MKRSAMDHPKMNRLAKLMKVKHWGAVGIMESVWHFTAKHAPQGDIGRWSNQEIAEAIGWDKNADALIDSLVSAKFIQTSAKFRLIVHDWHEHADDSVKKFLKSKCLDFATKQGDEHLQALTDDESRKVAKSSEKSRRVPPADAFPMPMPSLALPEPSRCRTDSQDGQGAEPGGGEILEVAGSEFSSSDCSGSESEQLDEAIVPSTAARVLITLLDLQSVNKRQLQGDINCFVAAAELANSLQSPTEIMQAWKAKAHQIRGDTSVHQNNRAKVMVAFMKKHLAKYGVTWQQKGAAV